MPGPAASPAVGPSPITPPPQQGVEAQALIKVRQAVQLLADSVATLKTNLDSDLGKAVLGALKMLSPHTPGVQEGLGQSELASLAGGISPVRRAPTMMGTPRPVPGPMGAGRPAMPTR